MESLFSKYLKKHPAPVKEQGVIFENPNSIDTYIISDVPCDGHADPYAEQ
jgi:hypothetical protein